MSDKLNESLSALMDDEANELEIERILSKIDLSVPLVQNAGQSLYGARLFSRNLRVGSQTEFPKRGGSMIIRKILGVNPIPS